MYSDVSNTVLNNRVKWHSPIGEFAYILDAEHLASGNGKAYQDVHKIVTIANIHNAQPYIDISTEDFNIYIDRMNKAAVNKVLEDVFDLNIKAKNGCNYDVLISSRAAIFDRALKLYMAVQVGELLVSSTRVNLEQHLTELSYNKIKIELSGATNSEGKTISVGLHYRYKQSISKIIKVLFPVSSASVFKSNENLW